METIFQITYMLICACKNTGKIVNSGKDREFHLKLSLATLLEFHICNLTYISVIFLTYPIVYDNTLSSLYSTLKHMYIPIYGAQVKKSRPLHTLHLSSYFSPALHTAFTILGLNTVLWLDDVNMSFIKLWKLMHN